MTLDKPMASVSICHVGLLGWQFCLAVNLQLVKWFWLDFDQDCIEQHSTCAIWVPSELWCLSWVTYKLWCLSWVTYKLWCLSWVTYKLWCLSWVTYKLWCLSWVTYKLWCLSWATYKLADLLIDWRLIEVMSEWSDKSEWPAASYDNWKCQ